MDFFLFDPYCMKRSATELCLIDVLLASRKEKFLIHPLIQIFITLKWQKTWLLYTLYIFIFGLFFFVLAGYSLTHYGVFYAETRANYGDTQTGWW